MGKVVACSIFVHNDFVNQSSDSLNFNDKLDLHCKECPNSFEKGDVGIVTEHSNSMV